MGKVTALEIARQHNLEAELREAMWNGCSPEDSRHLGNKIKISFYFVFRALIRNFAA